MAEHMLLTAIGKQTIMCALAGCSALINLIMLRSAKLVSKFISYYRMLCLLKYKILHMMMISTRKGIQSKVEMA